MEISEIKQRLSILQVLLHYNLNPDRNNMLKCPFHADDMASMKIYPNTNTFNCFGCGKNGDVIEFIQLKENCNKHEAILKASELCNGQMESKKLAPTVQTHYRASHPGNHTEILTKIFTYFQNGLNIRWSEFATRSIYILYKQSIQSWHRRISFNKTVCPGVVVEGISILKYFAIYF